MSKISNTQYAILGMLSIGPMSGYEISQMIEQSTANFWSESDGQLYPALKSLTKQRLISLKPPHKVSQKNNIRVKKIYAITPPGLNELKQWLIKEAETLTIRNEFMLKLFFGANIAAEINLEQLQAQRYQAKLSLAQLEGIEKELLQKYKKSPHLAYWLMTIQYGIHLNKAKLNWCDETTKILEKMRLKK